jgi:uncharacterized protein (TIGR03118 family)
MNRHGMSAARWSALAACSALASLAAGCGGGGYGGGSGNPTPTASLTVEPTTVTLGQSATLTWTASAGTSCDASGGWDGTEPASGTAEVTPTATGDLTYTLTCSGGAYSGSSMKSVTLTVDPASAFAMTSLVGDVAGGAATATDAHLMNPWGIAFGPTTGAWVANNHTGSATIYDGNGRASQLVVEFAADPDASDFDATGMVFNGTADFVVSNADASAPAVFIFDGESGRIAGWSPGVDLTHSITMYEDPDGAVYKGLAVANNGTGNFLYATDFVHAKIDVFSANFEKQPATATSFSFDDPTLPDGYAPFGIQAIRNGAGGATQLYVSYAKHDEAEPDEDVPGAGLGLVNVFDTNGGLLKHLITEGGKLNAPWGMALAPAVFGTLSNALLVGDFGDGAIHGYDPATGRYLGAVTDATGNEFAVPGLWGIGFGNDAVNQPRATLFFAAGTNEEADGLYGRIDLGDAPPTLGDAPVVTLTVPEGDLSGTVALTADVEDTLAISKVEFFVNGSTLIGTATNTPFTVQWDTTTVSTDSVKLRAVATDDNGNVGSSPIKAVSVANEAAATLTQIQQAVFTRSCSGCHDGSQPADGSLPGAMDLRAGHSFASLVNVASLEQPDLMRVKPGDAAVSYLIHKLEGNAGISGQRMPLGGPFLDAATIDQVKSWIASGAPSN